MQTYNSLYKFISGIKAANKAVNALKTITLLVALLLSKEKIN
jgi:hypothetical protein